MPQQIQGARVSCTGAYTEADKKAKALLNTLCELRISKWFNKLFVEVFSQAYRPSILRTVFALEGRAYGYDQKVD